MENGRTGIDEPARRLREFEHAAVKGRERASRIVICRTRGFRHHRDVIRVFRRRQGYLRLAQVRTTEGRHLAVRPRLINQPVHRVVTILPVPVTRPVLPLGFVASPSILYDDNIPLLHE